MSNIQEKITSETLTVKYHNNLAYVTFPVFNQYQHLIHGFSTKLGGVSQGIYQSLNLGFARGDADEHVYRNYQLFCEALGVNQDDLVFTRQEHEINILQAEEKHKGMGIIKPRDFASVDGLITAVPNVPLVGLAADCVLLFFFDPIQNVIGIAHAGWRGTVGMIGRAMVQKFVELYHSKEQDLLVGVAPSIGPCCYEVGAEVYQAFLQLPMIQQQKCFKPQANGKYLLDLWESNKEILVSCGVLEQHLTLPDLCTMCRKDVFFSHRGHHGLRGSLAGIIQLKGEK